jgi:hypothetical protein
MMDNYLVGIMMNVHHIPISDVSFEDPKPNLNKSDVIKDINNFMSGVDFLDQMTTYYSISRSKKG